VVAGSVVGRRGNAGGQLVEVLCRGHFLSLLQHDGRIVTADTEVRAQGNLQVRGAARLVDDVVEFCAFLGQFVEVTHRWNRFLFYRERADGCLYGPRGP
jgi:hypothetical protein